MYFVHFIVCFRLVKEITYREAMKNKKESPTGPDYTEEELEAGRRNKYPLHWTKGALEVLHEGVEDYLVTLLEDANLLAIHARQVTVQPRDIQLAWRIRGDKDWDIINYSD